MALERSVLIFALTMVSPNLHSEANQTAYLLLQQDLSPSNLLRLIRA